MRIIKLFLAGLSLVGVAAMVVLAPGAAGSTHSLADTGVASTSTGVASTSLTPDSTSLTSTSTSVTPDSMVWDLAAVAVS